MIADRQLGRTETVGFEPRLDGVDHPDHRTRLPFGTNANLSSRSIVRNRRALEEAAEPAHKPVYARGVSDGYANLHHENLRVRITDAGQDVEAGQIRLQPAFLRGGLLAVPRTPRRRVLRNADG